MTSSILIAAVGIAYFGVAIDQWVVQKDLWKGMIWFGYAIAQTGLWKLTVLG